MKRRKSNTGEMPILGHLKELRKALLIIAYAVAAGALVGWLLTPHVLKFLEWPASNIVETHEVTNEVTNEVTHEMTKVITFVNLSPMETLMVKLKLSLVIGVFITAPIIFWQIWSFLLPALKRSEKKYVYTAVPWSVLLFLVGGAFCFFFVLPLCLNFFVSLGQESIQAQQMFSVKNYVDFVLRFILCFGLVFELPVVLLLLTNMGILSPETLTKYRKYAFFFIVVAAVIISPTPDVWTLLLMIAPMYLLYEISIWLGKLIVTRKATARKLEEAQ